MRFAKLSGALIVIASLFGLINANKVDAQFRSWRSSNDCCGGCLPQGIPQEFTNHCAPACQPNCQDACGCPVSICAVRTVDCSACQCTVHYNGSQWIIQSACGEPMCFCKVPIVATPGPNDPNSYTNYCEDNPSETQKSFTIMLGTDNPATQRNYFFEVPPGTDPDSVVMAPFFVDLGGNKTWTLELEYKKNPPYYVPKVKPVYASETGLEATVNIVFEGGASLYGEHFQHATYKTRTYEFKRFKVRITREY